MGLELGLQFSEPVWCSPGCDAAAAVGPSVVGACVGPTVGEPGGGSVGIKVNAMMCHSPCTKYEKYSNG